MYVYVSLYVICFFFFFNDTATTEIYTLSLHDALPILVPGTSPPWCSWPGSSAGSPAPGCRRLRPRSEEHTSELQSREKLVCRLLLEKKKSDRFRHRPAGPQITILAR